MTGRIYLADKDVQPEPELMSLTLADAVLRIAMLEKLVAQAGDQEARLLEQLALLRQRRKTAGK